MSRPYTIPLGFTRRLVVYPGQRIEAQARHPVYCGWETLAKFGEAETYQATVYARSAKPWPASPHA